MRYNELVAVGQQVPERKKEDWYDRLAWWSDVKILGGLLQGFNDSKRPTHIILQLEH